MKVVVANLTRGGLSGGYRKYLRELLPRIAQDPRVGELVSFGPEDWPPDDALRGFRWLRARLNQLKPDVVFVPTARWIECPAPVVTMIRNMEPLLVPFGGNTWAEGARNLLRARATKRAATRSARVIAVSQYVKEVVAARWEIDERRIGVVSHGVEPVGVVRRPAALPEGVEREFIFTAGSIRPARGLEDVLRAMLEVDRDLVIAGAADSATEHHARAMRALAGRLGIAGRVHWIGRLDAEEMAWCFARARLFVMTSRAEACPNTVLEAMAEGTGSISTDQPPMPEFYGDAAIYYRRGDAADLARRLRETTDADLAALRERARRRAAHFPWQRTAAATVDELERALR